MTAAEFSFHGVLEGRACLFSGTCVRPFREVATAAQLSFEESASLARALLRPLVPVSGSQRGLSGFCDGHGVLVSRSP